MRRTIPLKIAAAGTALVLGGAVAAAAVTTPDEAEPGLTIATEKVGFDVPVGPPVTEPEEVEEVEEVEVEEVEEPEPVEVVEEELPEPEVEGERPENHGSVVSEFAETTELTGREKGQAIAEVARSDAGKPAAAQGKGGR